MTVVVRHVADHDHTQVLAWLFDGSVGPEGDTVIPREWTADPRRGGDRHAAKGSLVAVNPGGSCVNQVWASFDTSSCFHGVGGQGQHVWMNSATGVVIATVSSLPLADDDDPGAEHVAFFDGASHGGNGQ